MNNFGNYTFFLTNNQLFCYFHRASWSKYTMPPPQKCQGFMRRFQGGGEVKYVTCLIVQSRSATSRGCRQ